MPEIEIDAIKQNFINEIKPLRIYLFGSYAAGTEKADSDLDFYLVVDDGAENLANLTTRAYKAIRNVKRHPVDIVVGTASRFNERKEIPSVENEVYNKGVIIYG